MNISKIGLSQAESYLPREIKFDSVKHNTEKNTQVQSQKLSAWQEEILITAMDKLVNNIQVDNSHPLGRLENKPIETNQEALAVLEKINPEYLFSFGSEAQANVSAASFIQLVMEN